VSATLTDNPVRQAARALRDTLRAEHPGIASLALSGWESPDGKAYVCLDMIVLDPAYRRQGIGSAILRAILAAADEHGWTLCLTPSPIGAKPLSKTALTAWYRSFGFLPNSGRRRDWNTMEAMVRPAEPPWFADSAKGVSH
jgi:GNAT superfamily N-acetyltransferase